METTDRQGAIATAAEIDGIAAYCAELDRCYFVPRDLCTGRALLHLRLTPARNNQKLGIHWASEFEFGARLR